MTDSSEQQNEEQQHSPIDLGFIEELLRDAGLLRGSGLDQIFTTVGARFVPIRPEVATTEAPPSVQPGVDKLSNPDDANLDGSDLSVTTMPDGSTHD